MDTSKNKDKLPSRNWLRQRPNFQAVDPARQQAGKAVLARVKELIESRFAIM
ncbi:MAG: hypothetical protein ABSH28_22430 [Acidobacteriota bacterium]|jgi:hypothetical protein